MMNNEKKFNLKVFIIVLFMIIIISLVYIQFKGLAFSFDRIARTMSVTGLIVVIVFTIPGALNAPAGADEVAAQVHSSVYSNKSFNLNTAKKNMKGYGPTGGIPMIITYSGLLIAIISYILVI